ncbi:hypothetical protein AAIH70_16360 [Neorhizobium sp. BT27B]|uniref:hypothetical protein n=1 Tax=Neorhizobium sp. BT27B TaxID=3142625 RepID=UPI003D268B57
MTTPARENPHTLRAYARGIDTIPYVAVLAVPFAWAIWAMGVAGNAPPEEIEQSWMFKGYLATLFYAPSMAVCGVVEWWSRRRDRPRLRIAVRLFRWAHFLVAMGPIIVLFASVFL